MDVTVLRSGRSSTLAKRRIRQAVSLLGEATVSRILAFATYLLGWPCKEVAQAFGLSVPGLTSLVQQVPERGVERFVDQRRRNAWHPPKVEPVPESTPEPTVDIEQAEDGLSVTLNSCTLKLNRDDALARKVLAMLLVDSNVLTQKAAAEVMGTEPQAVTKSYGTYKAEGAKGLVDKRAGQKVDYKFRPQVKGELYYAYTLAVARETRPSSRGLAEHLTDVFARPFSPRGVSNHLRDMGLPLVAPRLARDLRALTEEGPRKKGLQKRTQDR